MEEHYESELVERVRGHLRVAALTLEALHDVTWRAAEGPEPVGEGCEKLLLLARPFLAPLLGRDLLTCVAQTVGHRFGIERRSAILEAHRPRLEARLAGPFQDLGTPSRLVAKSALELVSLLDAGQEAGPWALPPGPLRPPGPERTARALRDVALHGLRAWIRIWRNAAQGTPAARAETCPWVAALERETEWAEALKTMRRE